jgi:hypothetical protein
MIGCVLVPGEGRSHPKVRRARRSIVVAPCIIAWLVLTGCTLGRQRAVAPTVGPPKCPITQAVPPALVPSTVFDTMAAGASVPQQRANFRWWYGNDALWVYLYPNGRIPTRDEKFPWVRLVAGHLQISGQRLDGVAPPLLASVPDGYGATGFQASTIQFPHDGCWQVTGTLNNTALPSSLRCSRRRSNRPGRGAE